MLRLRFAKSKLDALVLAKFLDDSADDNIRMRAAELLLQVAARFKPPVTRRPLPDFPPTPSSPPFVSVVECFSLGEHRNYCCHSFFPGLRCFGGL
jgi:hypothetical protein